MKKRNRKRGSIFPKLLVSYFFFILIAVAIIFIWMLLQVLGMPNTDAEQLFPSEMVAEDGTVLTTNMLYQLGGWVERLDDTYRVTEVLGEKQTEDMSYEERQLLELTRTDDENDYQVFWEPYEGGSCLIFYPTDALEIKYTYSLNGMAETKEGSAALAILVALLLLEGIFVSYFIYRKIRIPLKKTVQGMERVTRGEQQVRLSFSAEGEFVEIQSAFNGMIDQLEQKEQEKKKLQDDRDRMLLELSHDLKTPLATIKSTALALEEGVVGVGEQERYFKVIETKTDRVNRMVDDMFTMLKMESSDYHPDFEQVDFGESVRQICAEYYDEVTAAGLEMEIEIPEETILVSADRTLLSRVIANLVGNAAKYNQTGSKIEIFVEKQEDMVCLSVADDGKEIEKEIQSTMFVPFVRGDASRKTTGGTGLGLAIANGIAKKHGGTVTYCYEQGKNQFKFELPLMI